MIRPIHIFLLSDDNFIAHTATVMASIIRNANKFTAPESNWEEPFKAVPRPRYLPLKVFLKLFIPWLCPEAAKDFMRGLRWLAGIDAEALHQEISGQAHKFIPVTEMPIPFSADKYTSRHAYYSRCDSIHFVAK